MIRSRNNRPLLLAVRISCSAVSTALMKQISGNIYRKMSHPPKEGIMKDLIFGVQVYTVGQELSEQGSDVDKSRQVSLEKNHHKPKIMDLKKLHKDLEVEDPRALVSSILQELPTSKFRLSPLAARAALASLVSSVQEDDGAKFGSGISKEVFMVNDLSSEETSLDNVNGVNDAESSKKARARKESSGRKGKKAKVESKTPETRRTTRSAGRKSDGDVSDDIVIQSPVQDIQKKGSTTRRISQSTIIEVKEESTVKADMEADKLVQTAKPVSSKRNRAKKSIEAREDDVESSENDAAISTDMKKVDEQSSVSVKNTRQVKGDSVKKLHELPVTGRVTRAALQRGNCNGSNDVEMMSEDTPARGSMKTRRSTNLEEKEDLVKRQNSDSNMTPKTEGKAKKKEQHFPERLQFTPRITRSQAKS